MFQLLKTFAKGYENYMTNVGRTQARRVLLSQGDRSLEDMGISRHLLLEGVQAWPWREGEVSVVASHSVEKNDRRQENRAIRELRAMSNAELADIGITRGGIVDAVRHGRRNDTDFAVPQPFKKEQTEAA